MLLGRAAAAALSARVIAKIPRTGKTASNSPSRTTSFLKKRRHAYGNLWKAGPKDSDRLKAEKGSEAPAVAAALRTCWIAAFSSAGVTAQDRYRVEHLQVIAPSDVSRLTQRGIIASMQPTPATSDMYWAEARVGPERVKGAYAWRTVLDAGRMPGAFRIESWRIPPDGA